MKINLELKNDAEVCMLFSVLNDAECMQRKYIDDTKGQIENEWATKNALKMFDFITSLFQQISEQTSK